MMTFARSTSVLTAVLLSLGSGCAAGSFAAVPDVAGPAGAAFEIRTVRYEGSSHGDMIVDVKNPSPETRSFSAQGLYFVPEGSAEHAPQRLGAAGPFTEPNANKTGYLDEIAIGAGETKRLNLGVFCLDHHRASPSSSTRFFIAKQRLPRRLRRAIYTGAQRIIRDNQGNVAASQSAIQDYVWKTRKSDRLELEGERRREN